MRHRAWLADLARLAGLAGALGGMLAWPASAQLPLPLGTQALANTSLVGDQDEVAVAIDPNGDFVVVWRDELIDGFLSAVVGRKFSSRTGLPLSGEFVINITVAGDQRNPAIAMAANGRFVVTWESPDSTLPATSGIFGTLRNPDTTPIVAEFPVNTLTQGTQQRPAIAMQPNGSFLVAWQDDFAFGEGDSGENIVGRLYPATFPADPPSNPFEINTVTGGDQEEPAAAPIPATGGWYVGWQGPFPPMPIPSILVRVLTSSGSGQPEIPVNSTTTIVPRKHVALASNALGDAVAAWEAPDASYRGIFSRRLDAGIPTGLEEPVNLSTDLDEREPSVAMDERGAFVTVWVVASPSLGGPWDESPAGSPIVIQGRKRGATGGLAGRQPPPADGEFQVSSSGATFLDPWVVTEPHGDFVAAWQATDALDPDGNGAFYRRFLDAIFADDFETHDTSRWSAAFP